MHVLLVSEYFPPRVFGGGEISAYLLAKNLAKKGVRVSVLTSRVDGLDEFEVKDGFDIYRRLSTGESPRSLIENLKRKLLFPRSVKKELRELDDMLMPDVIHFLNTTSIVGYKTDTRTVATINSYGNFCPKSNLFYWDRSICARSCNFHEFKDCMLHSEYIGKIKLKNYLKYNPLFWVVAYLSYVNRNHSLLEVDEFIVPSWSVKQTVGCWLIGEGESDRRVHKIPSIFECKETGDECHIKEREVTVVCIGALEKIKGVDMLVRAFDSVDEDAELILIGHGSERGNLEEIAGSNVNFFGNVVYKFIPSIYKQADIVVLPSRWPEPLSRVLIEAAYFGKPVVATDVGGNPEGVADGVNGFLVNTEVELIEKLRLLIGDKELRDEMGSKGRERFNKKFNPRGVIDEIIEVYKKNG